MNDDIRQYKHDMTINDPTYFHVHSCICKLRLCCNTTIGRIFLHWQRGSRNVGLMYVKCTNVMTADK